MRKAWASCSNQGVHLPDGDPSSYANSPPRSTEQRGPHLGTPAAELRNLPKRWARPVDMVSDVSPRRAVDRGMESCKEKTAVLVPLRGPALLDHLGPPSCCRPASPCGGPVSPQFCSLSQQQTSLTVKGWSSSEGQVGAKSEGWGHRSRDGAWRSMQALNSWGSERRDDNADAVSARLSHVLQEECPGPIVLTPAPVKVTLFGNRISADVVEMEARGRGLFL